MDRENFVSLYNEILKGNTGNNPGITLIRQYIQEEGSKEQEESSDLFLNVIAALPPLYQHCLNHVLDYYVNKFSVVKIIKQDLNSLINVEQIILVY